MNALEGKCFLTRWINQDNSVQCSKYCISQAVKLLRFSWPN